MTGVTDSNSDGFLEYFGKILISDATANEILTVLSGSSPGFPISYYGNATLPGGGPVPDNMIVRAWFDLDQDGLIDLSNAPTPTGSEFLDYPGSATLGGLYGVIIPADNPVTLTIKEGYNPFDPAANHFTAVINMAGWKKTLPANLPATEPGLHKQDITVQP